MPRTPCFQIDAFTDRPFRGNPAAVCLLAEEADDAWMQSVAAEMNLAETAFVRQLARGYSLRWFTPEVEVDLCGHATLATAHALWTELGLSPEAPLEFHTRSGLLTCRRNSRLIEMDFPALAVAPADARPELLAALGIDKAWTGRTSFDDLVDVEHAAMIRALRPDFRRLADVTTRGVIVTAPADGPDADFVSRFFAPRVGIDEDPVTGSAHCALAPYWAARLGKTEMTGYQASRRGGYVRVRVTGDRVILAGSAVTVLRGELA